MTRTRKDKATVMSRTLKGLGALSLAVGMALPAFAAKEEFSTWTPRKGKMTYERDSLQPEWGMGGRGDTFKVTCAQLKARVGQNGTARDGDTLIVTSPVCNLGTLTVYKAVNIVAASTPPAPRFDYSRGIDEGLKTFGVQYKSKLNCQTLTAPCITINLPPEKVASIVGFHIKTNGNLLAPLVESRSGGLILKNNFLEGEYRKPIPEGEERPRGFERATAVLVHGSKAILKGNTIVHARSGIALLPTQKSPDGSIYAVDGNRILRMGEAGITADGSIFYDYASPRPGVKVGVTLNEIDAYETGYAAKRVESRISMNTFDPEYLVRRGVIEDQAQRQSEFNAPKNEIVDGRYSRNVCKSSPGSTRCCKAQPNHSSCQTPVTSRPFTGAYNHINIQDGVAFISYNVFRDARDRSIAAFGLVKLYIDNNLFDHNKLIIDHKDLGYSMATGTPYPAGNICREQPFESQYNGADKTLQVIDISSGGLTEDDGPVTADRRKRNALWNAYDAYFSGIQDCTGENASACKRSRGPSKMWAAFKAYFLRTQDQVYTHALFERPDVRPGEGYYSCVDYSTLYRFTNGGGGDFFQN